MKPRINIHYVYVDEETNLGFMQRIEFPDGRDTIYFDEEKGNIDLNPLNEYKGHPMVIHYQDKPNMYGVIDEVKLNEDGINTLHIEAFTIKEEIDVEAEEGIELDGEE